MPAELNEIELKEQRLTSKLKIFGVWSVSDKGIIFVGFMGGGLCSQYVNKLLLSGLFAFI